MTHSAKSEVPHHAKKEIDDHGAEAVLFIRWRNPKGVVELPRRKQKQLNAI